MLALHGPQTSSSKHQNSHTNISSRSPALSTQNQQYACHPVPCCCRQARGSDAEAQGAGTQAPEGADVAQGRGGEVADPLSPAPQKLVHCMIWCQLRG